MKTLLDYLQENRSFVNALCNGQGTCGKCKVKVENVLPNQKDYEKLSKEEIEEGYVLACQHLYDESMKISPFKPKGEILTSFHQETIEFQAKDGFGMIVDIGTTTVVLNLVDLRHGHIVDVKSTYNPQISYGGDVISRIQYDSRNPHHLHQCIVDTIKESISGWLSYDLKQMILTGNTTMIHLFNDMNTASLGVAPFTVYHKGMYFQNAKDVFGFEKDFEIITLPHISAYVGSDIVTGMYALKLFELEESCIFLDLGTNGEIVAGNKHHMAATSSAAGPAFEGGGIECGGASVDGAIYRVEEKEGTLQLYTINDQKPTCICGTGLISLIAYLRRKGIINELGRFKKGIHRFNITDKIYLTSLDIQNFLLAKSAIQTSLEVMLEKYPHSDSIYISGGFGNKLNIDDLVTLQVIPETIKDQVILLKNTALQGTYQLLLNQDFTTLERMISHVESIELASYEDFEDRLIDNLFI